MLFIATIPLFKGFNLNYFFNSYEFYCCIPFDLFVIIISLLNKIIKSEYYMNKIIMRISNETELQITEMFYIFSIGIESCVVAISNYAVVWFSGKELNMVFAIIMNIGRIGSSIVFEGAEPTLQAVAATGIPQDQVLGHALIARNHS